MFPLFETICIVKQQVQNIALHQQRYEKSVAEFYGGYVEKSINLVEIIDKNKRIYSEINSDIIRCRIDYNKEHYQIQFFPYQRKNYRTFQPVICDDIDYHLKFSHRAIFEQLLQQKQGCDEIIIIKQGNVTDCSIGNLIFRKNNQWMTSNTPLLKGTQRQKLLAEGKIQERRILLEDLPYFDEVRVINALNGL
ncbi:aminotransferase class IV family protein [Seminibacterium arietis]|uniref:Aminotransferase class IV family protein n=1 Tax=Seminibacterium arietis TaxID=1173502 RepID=A0ABW3I9Z8_9PAST